MTTAERGAEAVADDVKFSDDADRGAVEDLRVSENADKDAAEGAAKNAVTGAGGNVGSLEISERANGDE